MVALRFHASHAWLPLVASASSVIWRAFSRSRYETSLLRQDPIRDDELLDRVDVGRFRRGRGALRRRRRRTASDHEPEARGSRRHETAAGRALGHVTSLSRRLRCAAGAAATSITSPA